MKRLILTATASSMLALALPGIASAANSRARHHHARHASTHARALAKHAGAHTPATTSTGTRADAPPGPAATPTPPAGEPAGTVVSFEGGKLTIELSDGTKLTGQVTEETEIHCPAPAPASNGGEGQGGEDHNSGSAQGGGEDSGDPACTTSALIAGAKVMRAELSVAGTGPLWERVDLMTP